MTSRESEPRVRRLLRIALPGLVIATIWLAYANTLRAPFVFDDRAAILENSTIRTMWPLAVPLSPPDDGRAVAGRPLINLSLALNYAISGENPWSYHVFNLLVHSGAALLVFGIVRHAARALRKEEKDETLLPWIVAALWALHPLQTESVACVIQRTELLGGFFYLATILAFAVGRPGLSVAACLLGMATKETMVTAPLLVLLYDRTFVSGSFRAAWRTRRVYYMALSTTWLMLAWLVWRHGGARGTAAGFGAEMSSWHYLLQQTRAILLYLKLSVWPHPLVIDYGSTAPHGLAEVWWQSVIVLVLLGATAWALVRRPVIGFLGGWFFVILAPSSSVVPLPAQTIAEHRMYLPLVTIVVLATAGLGRIRSWIAVPLLVAMIAATWTRNEVYRSDLALWTETARHQPENPRVQLNLGAALLTEGRIADAATAFQVAARANLPSAHSNLANVYLQLGRVAEAITEGEIAVELSPTDANAWVNLTLAVQRSGDLERMRAQVARVARLSLRDAQLYELAGILAVRTENFSAALELFQRAVAIDGDFVAARANLGNVLLVGGRFDEAITEYQAVLQRKPDERAVRENLERARELKAATRQPK